MSKILEGMSLDDIKIYNEMYRLLKVIKDMEKEEEKENFQYEKYCKDYYKTYYVVTRTAYLTDDGRNTFEVPVMVIEDEDICKDFCEKYHYKYHKEIVENHSLTASKSEFNDWWEMERKRLMGEEEND